MNHWRSGWNLLRSDANSLDPGEVEVRRAHTADPTRRGPSCLHKALLGIALTTLLAAALGLLNIGLATVRDRTRELTSRRAAGATRSVHRRPAHPVILGLLIAVLTVAGTCAAVTLLVPLLIDQASALHRLLPD
ncbi:hypothetical protein P3T37_004264 [Kitasatospora sp. MAA4]|uniref:hypothetical protein n=1 Tax=Kitasatospora sp. MAA4 TaxID=3035093 RepID=UPI002476A0ED|nr:hypothetical protein [Kitasatospora sp. MAA4]MDH6134855.1 hypothetical protein [Kitasatospora sp. MAA4]